MSPRPAFPVPLCTHTRVHTHTCAHIHVPFPDACPPCTLHPDRLRRAPAALWASRSLQGKEELTKLEAADKLYPWAEKAQTRCTSHPISLLWADAAQATPTLCHPSWRHPSLHPIISNYQPKEQWEAGLLLTTALAQRGSALPPQLRIILSCRGGALGAGCGPWVQWSQVFLSVRAGGEWHYFWCK